MKTLPILSRIRQQGREGITALTSTEAARLRSKGVSCSTAWAVSPAPSNEILKPAQGGYQGSGYRAELA